MLWGMHPRRSIRGFTLLELLVVIAIIGILSAVVLAILNSARIEGRDARRIADLKEVRNALELYYDDVKSYPAAIDDLVPNYLTALPGDPLGNASYYYDQLGGGSDYHVGANLEITDHEALDSDEDSLSDTINGADTADCGGGSISGRRCYDIGP